MFFCDIDEFSFVIRYELDETIAKIEDHQKELLFNGLDEMLNLSDIFGKPEQAKGMYGYDVVWSYSDLIRIAYSTTRLDMGMHIHFTASGTKDMLIKGYDQLKIIRLINQFVADNKPYLTDWHMSKVDVAMDFVDEGISVDKIGHAYNAGDIVLATTIYDKDSGALMERKSKATVSTVVNDGTINTIYIGSRKSKSNLVVRFYNKKLEQQENKNKRYTSVMESCDNWVRYEYSFRHDYAKAITKYVRGNLDTLTCSDLFQWLVAKCLERLVLYKVTYTDNDGEIEVSQEYHESIDIMIANSSNNANILRIEPEPLNNLYDYFRWQTDNDSGLIGWLWKVREIYGDKAVEGFFETCKIALRRYNPSDSDKKYIKLSNMLYMDRDDCPWI